jgi:uncharacterized membrane protein (UPF0182 family)
MLKFILKWLVVYFLLVFLLVNISKDYHCQVLYGSIIAVPIYFFIVIVFIVAAASDVFSVVKTKKWLKLIPSAVGIVIVIVSAVIFILTSHNQMKINRFVAKPLTENSFEECSYFIDFKNDGTYTSEHSIYTISYYNFGNYVRRGDFIFLDGDFNTKGVSPIMKIVTSINEKTNKPILKLIQVDKKGKQLKNKVEYKFIEI